MKKVVMMATLAALSLSGCKKEDKTENTPDNRPNEEKILGLWSVDFAEGFEYDQTNNDTLSSFFFGGGGLSLNFVNANTCYTRFAGFLDTINYTINTSHISLISQSDTDVYSIQTLTGDNLTFHRDEILTASDSSIHRVYEHWEFRK